MSKSKAFENDLLNLIFNAKAISALADNAASGPLTTLYVALHTADPGEGGNQTTNEVNYTGYARVAVARSAGGWTVSGSSVSPTQPIEFGEMTAGSPSTATHASVGTSMTGTGKMLYYGAIDPTIPIQVGTVPRLRDGSTITEG